MINEKFTVAISLLYATFFSTSSYAGTLYFKDKSALQAEIINIDFDKKTIITSTKAGDPETHTFKNLRRYGNDADTKSLQAAGAPKNIKSSQINIDSDSTVGYRLTAMNVGYYIVRDYLGADNDIRANLSGVDLSAIFYTSNSIGVEIGAYQGSTSEATLEATSARNNTEVALSNFTDINHITTYGFRMGVMAGWNLRDSGFRAYAGAGIYTEYTRQNKVDNSKESEFLRGGAFKFGLGWGWQSAAVDFWGSVRSDQPSGFLSGSSQGGIAFTYFLR